MKINILDENTINKISAGEVVDRPSSIIKELVENSIDSGATKITIEIKDGGKSLIKITDNGSGIKSSEVDKAIIRHATSKIIKVEDLYDLYSLGFRGEALSSITAVSKFKITTKTKDESIGTRLVVHGGKIVLKEGIGSSNGTSITVEDIFYNTPARKKFLKSTQAETINITEYVNKLSIVNPNIQFRYINNNKIILITPGDNNLLNIIRTIHGREICENLINVNNDLINGFIGNNNIYRSNRNFQYISINKRLVKSKLILDMIFESYKGIIPINKHSIVFVNINLDPKTIDVNIHPTKLEVKFENEREILYKLKSVINESLLSVNLVGRFNIDATKKVDKFEFIKHTKEGINIIKNDNKKDEESINIKYEKVDIDKIKPFDIQEENVNIFKNLDEVYTEKGTSSKNLVCDKKEDIYLEKIKEKTNDNSKKEKLKIDNEQLKISQKSEPLTSIQQTFTQEDKINFLDFKISGTLFDTYLILSNRNNMYLMDQHATHEKIIYEEYIEKYNNLEISSQMLLDPIIIELSSVDFLKVEENLNLFIKFGFEIEIFGKNHLMIRSVPTMFEKNISEKFILEIIDNIYEINNGYELKEEKIISMACKKAIKANKVMNEFEIKDLLKKLNNCKNPFTCPHGRPTIIEIKKTDIEKMFKRII
ncbi:MAG: DNA mismatch repair endonuclease MutL [Peptostreptococcaceae bacterium]